MIQARQEASTTECAPSSLSDLTTGASEASAGSVVGVGPHDKLRKDDVYASNKDGAGEAA